MAKKIKDENGNVYVKKTPFYKKWWFILIIVVVIIAAIQGRGGSSTKSTSNTNTAATSEQTSTTSQAESTSSSAESSSSAPSYKIGDVVKVGDVEYTVNSRTTAQNVGGEFGKTANGTYLILNVTVKNDGKKAITVTDNFFALFKGDTKYETDSTAGIYANEDAKFFLNEVNPENSVTGNVVFDLTPETANDPSLILQVQTGVWGTQKGQIALN